MSTLGFRLEQTLASVKKLSSVVRQLVATTPQRNNQLLQPNELAQLLGIAPRTLVQWRTDGRFRPISVRKQGRPIEIYALCRWWLGGSAVFRDTHGTDVHGRFS